MHVENQHTRYVSMRFYDELWKFCGNWMFWEDIFWLH